ncbi:hypothetical protein C8R47DRAFT_1325129 [Mycena vitilis]|nr:hypothetical protein C8R47DRAFT_1325129 [Mycena vitilis]
MDFVWTLVFQIRPTSISINSSFSLFSPARHPTIARTMATASIPPPQASIRVNSRDTVKANIGDPAKMLERRKVNDIALFGPRFDHYTLEDRHSVWSRIINLALPDGHNNPVLFASARGDLAALCKASLDRTYNDVTLWSTLYLNHRVLPERIHFVLKKSGDAPLRVRLVLLDIPFSPPTGPDDLCADCLVDRIFGAIYGTNLRWSSFYLNTDHPEAFLRVQDHCRGLDVPKMRSLSLIYGDMARYPWLSFDDDSEGPFESENWFKKAHATLNHLELQSVYLLWQTPGLFCLVTTLDLSRIYDVDWAFFQTLFSTAANLRFLRLESIDHCELPEDATIYSQSLTVLDLGLDGLLFMSEILRAIRAPNLVDLTLRDIGHRMYHVLRCGTLLKQLTRFAIVGPVLYDTPLDFDESTTSLFDSLSNLMVLDLHNTRADMFAAYRYWTYMRGKKNNPISSKLEALYVGYTPVESMLAFLVFHGVRDFGDGSHMTLKFIRMKRSLPVSADMAVTNWFRTRLVNFDFLDYQNATVSIPHGPAYHSLCCFAA